jgi:NADPH:quinone reductase
MSSSNQMQAWAIDEFGEPDHFRRQSAPRPIPGAGEVLIRVAATSVNPVDCKIRRGERPAIAPPLPAILQGDVAGVIEEIGPEVTDFKIGDEVFGCVGGFKDLGGSLADFTIGNVQLLARKPTNLSHPQAAALPLVTITAWEGLHDRANISAGQSVLIHAGTGGVGHVAVQLSRAAGAKVATTISGDAKAAALHEICGPELETINYRTEEVTEYMKRLTGGNGFDIVFDTVGGPNLGRSFGATRRHGQVVNILSMAEHDLSQMHLKALSLHVVFMLIPMITGEGRSRHGAILREAAKLVEDGMLKPLIDCIHPFDDASEAHRRAESGQQIGKVVLVHPEHIP